MVYTNSGVDQMSGMSLMQPTREDSPEFDDAEALTVEGLASQLVSLASFTTHLYLQAHLIHLNIEGPLFLPVHEFLKDQYDAHVGQTDQLAEFVRTLDVFMPMCERGLLGAYKSFKHVKSYETRDMLYVYLTNIEKCGMSAKDVGEYARELKAPDVENYMAELVGAMFKAAWFLKSTMRG